MRAARRWPVSEGCRATVRRRFSYTPRSVSVRLSWTLQGIDWSAMGPDIPDSDGPAVYRKTAALARPRQTDTPPSRHCEPEGRGNPPGAGNSAPVDCFTALRLAMTGERGRITRHRAPWAR